MSRKKEIILELSLTLNIYLILAVLFFSTELWKVNPYLNLAYIVFTAITSVYGSYWIVRKL